MAKRRTRDLKKEARWRKVVAQQQRSGLSVRQYCQEHSLTESAFWFWKRELARRDAEQRLTTSQTRLTTASLLPGPRRGPARRESSQGRRPRERGPALGLVPISIGPALGAMATIEVVLSGGVSVRVMAGCDEATLRMVLWAVSNSGPAAAGEERGG